MRIEDNSSLDTAPFEFLFGKVSDEGMELKQQNYPNILSNVSIDGKLGFLYFIYSICVFISFYIIFNQLQNYYFHLLILIPSVSIFITSLKNELLIRKFAPDLIHDSMKITKFSFLQVVLSNIIGGFVLLFTYFMIYYVNEFQISPPYFIFLIILFLVIYTKLVNDLAIASLGLGISLLPSWGGISHTIRNIQETSSIKGKFSTRLAILRLVFWQITVIVILMQEYWLFVIQMVFLINISMKWEKNNASSLFMQVRSKVHNSAPVLLPYLSQTEELKKQVEPHLEKNNMLDKKNNQYHRNSTFNNSLRDPIRQRNNLNNLVPVAVKTINRIADSIKDEESFLPSNLSFYCRICNLKADQSGSYCQQCGNPVEFFNGS